MEAFRVLRLKLAQFLREFQAQAHPAHGMAGKDTVPAKLPWRWREGEETRVYHFRLRP